MRALTFLIIVIGGTALYPVHAQRRQTPPSAKQERRSPYVSALINLDLKALPPNCRGADPEALYKNLEKRKGSAVKGEFETTADFNRRVVTVSAAPVGKP